MTREEARTIIIATAEVDESVAGEDLEACAPGEHPVDADITAQETAERVYSPDGDDITDFSPEDQAYLLSKPPGFWCVEPVKDHGYTGQRNDPRFNPEAFSSEADWLNTCLAIYTPEEMIGFSYEPEPIHPEDLDDIPF